MTHPLALAGVLEFREITYGLSADLRKTLTAD